MKILRLTKQLTSKNINELIEIDKNIKSDEIWDTENFLMDYPEKWRISLIAIEDNKIVGFIVCSIKNNVVLHIHRFAIKKEYQRKGIGKSLLDHIFQNRSDTMKCITLNVYKDNIPLQQFYEKLGFNRSYSTGNNYLYWRKLE
jgi:ribosomal protein S18 acetylase RimI-like enzyme